MISAAAAGLAVGGVLVPSLKAKSELARIGYYYATESMLVRDPVQGHYDADATPEIGQDTLPDFYLALARGDVTVARGDHAVF